MAKASYDNLKPGGKFVAVVVNSKALKEDPDGMDSWKSVGLKYHVKDDVKEGDPMTLAVFDMRITIYFWAPETYISVLTNVGFKKVRYLDVHDLAEKGGAGKWLQKFRCPYFAILEGFKPSN